MDCGFSAVLCDHICLRENEKESLLWLTNLLCLHYSMTQEKAKQYRSDTVRMLVDLCLVIICIKL